jgi:hypothetical protein
MENKVTKLLTEREKYLQESIQMVHDFSDMVEQGKIEKFIIVAYDDDQESLLSIHSKPMGVSYYEYVGFLDAVRDHMLSKANGL